MTDPEQRRLSQHSCPVCPTGHLSVGTADGQPLTHTHLHCTDCDETLAVGKDGIDSTVHSRERELATDHFTSVREEATIQGSENGLRFTDGYQTFVFTDEMIVWWNRPDHADVKIPAHEWPIECFPDESERLRGEGLQEREQ